MKSQATRATLISPSVDLFVPVGLFLTITDTVLPYMRWVGAGRGLGGWQEPCSFILVSYLKGVGEKDVKGSFR